MVSVCTILVTDQLLTMTSIAMRIHGSGPTTTCSVSIGVAKLFSFPCSVSERLIKHKLTSTVWNILNRSTQL